MFNPFRKPVDINEERRNVANIALGIASVMFFTLIAQLIIVPILDIFAPSLLDSTLAGLFINAIAMYGIAMPLSMVFFKNCKTYPMGSKRISFPAMLLVIAACFGMTYIGSILGSFMDALSSALLGNAPSNPVAETVDSIPLWAILLFVVIFAPVFEEIFFRRIVIDRLRRYGDIPAIVISGLAFGFIHGNFSQFFYATFLGMLFGAIYIYTGKLRYTIFLHMLVNFMGSFYTTFMIERFGGEIPAEITQEVMLKYPDACMMMNFYSLLYIVSLVAAIPALIFLAKKFKAKKGAVRLNDQQGRAVFATFGFWFSVIFLIGNFATSLLLA